MNEVFIEKFNLTTIMYDRNTSGIKLPEYSKDPLCYLDISNFNKTVNTCNKRYEKNEEIIKIKNDKESNFSLNKNENIYKDADILNNPFTKGLKVNEKVNNLQKSNPKKNDFANKNYQLFSFLRIKGIFNTNILY